MALGVVAAVVEVLVPHFGVIFVSVASLGGALLAFLGFDVTLQLIAFLVVLGLSLAFLRPRFLSRLGSAPGIPGRTEALVGRSGLVTEAIDPTVGTGRVNVGGEDWAARSSAVVPVGTRVRVTGADGIVLEVTPS
jgi:membrane protein implicated in regulation of membrane protease activity